MINEVAGWHGTGTSDFHVSPEEILSVAKPAVDDGEIKASPNFIGALWGPLGVALLRRHPGDREMAVEQYH